MNSDEKGSDFQMTLNPATEHTNASSSEAAHDLENLKELSQLEQSYWIYDNCERGTGVFLKEIALPWYSQAEDQKAEFERDERNHIDLLDKIKARHYRGFIAEDANEVVQQKLNEFENREPWGYSGLNEDETLRKSQQGVDYAFTAASNGIALKKTKSEMFWYFFKTTSTFMIFLIFGGAAYLFTKSAALGFGSALFIAIGIPKVKADNRVAEANSLYSKLVTAVSINQYWLTKHSEQFYTNFIAEKNQLMLEIENIRTQIYSTDALSIVPPDHELWESWKPVEEQAEITRIGESHLNVNNGTQLPDDALFKDGISLPVLIDLRRDYSVYITIAGDSEVETGNSIAKSIVFKMLAFTPPGRIKFTFIDPIGQGQNVANFLELADYDESLVNSKAWSDSRQIERKLTDLTEHMDTVIQKYLRADYETIEEYNKAAGEIAEAYRVVVVFDYPDSFTENAARQLERIAQNGKRCGVYAIIVHNALKKTPYHLENINFYKHSLLFRCQNNAIYWDNYEHGRSDFDKFVTLKPDSFPSDKLVKHVIKSIGEKSKIASKVEVPYEKILKQSGINTDSVWSENTDNGIRIPLGPGNAKKPIILELGVGLSVHAILIGRPGSGKSNLLHVVINTAVRLYKPDDLELYLIDFKEGVEFKPYADAGLPHTRVIAIKSEREFGLSVLRKLDSELKERGEKFRSLGANNIVDYRNKQGKMTRVLLIVDEFQEFFVKRDQISDEAELLFDRLVRQGRSAGVHILLGSQTLAGYSLPKATLNLITGRIAMQSSEADSRMIFADDNTAPRLLSRPGEAIYNPSSGLVEGNNLFQVALFTEQDRLNTIELIRHAKVLSEQDVSIHKTIVFEGHETAVLENSEPLTGLLNAPTWPTTRRLVKLWLGEPIEIKPPTQMELSNQSGSHLLVVTRNEEEAIGVLMAATISLLAQFPPQKGGIAILNLATADSEWADVPNELQKQFIGHSIKILDKRSLRNTLEHLSSYIKEMVENGGKKNNPFYLVIIGLHRARDLRDEGFLSRSSLDLESSPNLASCFATILRDGPECGVHVLAWCDSYANLSRVANDSLVSEFGIRIVGQMSQSDSSRLIDDDAAANLDRPHRMIKYDENKAGVLEVFRPYALPSQKWLVDISASLNLRQNEMENIL